MSTKGGLSMTNITVRVDETVKHEAETLFDKLGMSVSGAINIFFRQAIREQGIPFTIRMKADDDIYDISVLEEAVKSLRAGKGIKKSIAELEAMENE
jgi:DNA-damage-inducible protein J